MENFLPNPYADMEVSLEQSYDNRENKMPGFYSLMRPVRGFVLYSENGLLHLSDGVRECILCSGFVSFSVWVTVERFAKMEKYLAMGIEDSEIILFTTKELAGSATLNRLRVITGERMEAAGIPDSKIARAFNSYLLNKAKESEEVIIPQKAGWNLENNRFFSMNTGDIFEKILMKNYRTHSILCRKLPDVKEEEKAQYPYLALGLTEPLYEVLLFGAVSRSLLMEAGVREFLCVWFHDDSKTWDFINNYLKIWDGFLPEGDAGSTRDIKEVLSESKDELIVIREHMKTRTSANNISRLQECLKTSAEFAKGVPFASVPIFVTKDYEPFRKAETMVFPFWIGKDFDYQKIHTSARIVLPYIRWCEKNFSKLSIYLDRVSREYEISKENENLPYIKVFVMTEALVLAYQLCVQQFNDKDIEEIFSLLKEKEKMAAILIQLTEKNRRLSAVEIVRNGLIDAYKNEKIRLKTADTVQQRELSSSVIYDKAGYTYLSAKLLDKLLNQTNFKNLIERLIQEDALETERNGEGRRRADVKCAIPRGCGRDQNRLYKFKKGVLLTEGGWLIGTEPSDRTENSICLGVDAYGHRTYYPISEVKNMHTMVTGAAGEQRTSFICNYVKQMCDRGIICLMPDYSHSYIEEMNVEGLTEVIDIVKFPVNPFSRRKIEGVWETIPDCAIRGTKMVEKMLHFSPEETEIFSKVLTGILQIGVAPTFDLIYREVQELGIGETSRLHRMKKFCKRQIFANAYGTWENFLSGSNRFKILQMDTLKKDVAAELTDLILLDLINWQARQFTRTNQGIVFWLEEVQNLSSDEDMPVSILMRERQKLDMEVIAVSQAFHKMSGAMQKALCRAALKIYFQQDNRGARRFASDEADTEAERRRLSKEIKTLPEGQFYAAGDFLDINGNICEGQCWRVYQRVDG